MSDWKTTTVGKVASGFLNGGTPTTKRLEYWEGKIPWTTSKRLDNTLELSSGEKYISDEAVEKSSTNVVPKGNILFTTRVGVGKVAINRIDIAISQDLTGVLIDSKNYDTKFLVYQLGIDSIQQYVSMNKRGATIKGITRDCLKQIRINIPPLPEQKKIAHILSTVQRAIAAQERIIQTTTELFKTMLHQLMTAQIRVSKENHITENHEDNRSMSGWRERQVKELGKIVTGGTPQTKRKDFYGGDYNLISPADLDNGKYTKTAHKRLTKLGFEQCRALPKNTVLVGCIGNVGKLGMVGNEQSATNQQINALICNSDNDPEFVYYCFYANRDNLAKRAVKSIVPILNKTNFGNIEVKVPSLPEQKKIAQILSINQQKIDNAESKKIKLQSMFRTLLHELMTAKIRVHELELVIKN